MKRVVYCIAFVLLYTAAFAITPFESSRQKDVLVQRLELSVAEKTKAAFMTKALQAADTAYILWEQEALAEYEQMKALGGDDEQLQRAFEQLTMQAREYIQALLAGAEGRFDARCAQIVMPQYAKDELLARIAAMTQQSPLHDMVETYRAWDEQLGVYVQDIVNAIGLSFESQWQELIEGINTTIEEYRDAFIQQIDARIETLAKEAKRDIELYYIGARNAYMVEHFSDTRSLRVESQKQSAEAITQAILYETQNKADELFRDLEDKLAYNPGAVTVQQADDIEALVQAGIYAWKAAEDRLIAARLSWERSASDSYDIQDKAWEEAFETLQEKRNEWYQSIQRQIQLGTITWQESFLETDQQFADALKILDETIQAQREQFDDYSNCVRDLIVTGSQSLALAYQNIGWLKEYADSLAGSSNLIEIKQAVDEQIQNWNAIISKYNELVARQALQYHHNDMWAEQRVFIKGQFAQLYSNEAQRLAENEAVFRELYAAVREGTIGSNIQSVDALSLSQQLAPVILSIQWVQQMAAGGLLPFDDVYAVFVSRYGSAIETYRTMLAAIYHDYVFGIITYNGMMQAKQTSSGWLASRCDHFINYIRTHTGSFEELFGYTTKGSGLLSDDRYDDNGNPLYKFYWYQDQQGVVLINDYYPVEHDPYLMTQAEFDLEKEKLTLAYWEERYRRAQKLYDYAFNETERPDVQTQKENLQNAIEAYTKAKQDYNNALDILKGQLKEALVLAQQDVDNAQRILQDMRMAYEAAQARYQDAVEKSQYYTNPLSQQMAIDMVQQAAQTIASIKNRIQDKEQKLLTAKIDYYKAVMLQERHDQTIEYAKRTEKAIRALKGTEQTGGLEYAFNVWNKEVVSQTTLQAIIGTIEEKSNELFVDMEALFPEGTDDAVGFLMQGTMRQKEAREAYEQALSAFDTWERIYASQDVQAKVREVIVYLLHEYGASVDDGACVSWDTFEQLIEQSVAGSEDERDYALSQLVTYTAGLLSSEDIENVRAQYTGLNAEELYDTIEAMLLTHLLKARYGNDMRQKTQEGWIYPPVDMLYGAYQPYIEMEYTASMAGCIRAVTILGESIRELYTVSYRVVDYLLKDMHYENLETSVYTKQAIQKAAAQAQKEAAGSYFAITGQAWDLLKENIVTYMGDSNRQGTSDAATYGDELYGWLQATCKNAMLAGNSRNALAYAYMYTLLEHIEESVRSTTNPDEVQQLLDVIEKYRNDLETVLAFYRDEVAQCRDEKEVKALIDTYTTMVNTGTDSQGNALTNEQKEIAAIKLGALIHPEMYDMVRPNADARQTESFVMEEFARYVDFYYELSPEYARRKKEEGWLETIARIFGIGDGSAVEDVLAQPLSVAQLMEYGKKAESYINTKEYGKLPAALKEALQQVVSQYHSLLTKKALYDNRYTSEEQAKDAYLQAQQVYDTLVRLQDTYNQLIELRKRMYSDEDITYAVQRYSYYEVVPNGTWPGFTDAVISKLKECERMYNEIKDLVDATPFKDVHMALLAKLQQLETVRQEYELVDYTARYLSDTTGVYGTVDEYCARLTGQGKTQEFIMAVKAEIEKQLHKRRLVEKLINNETTPAILQQDAGDTYDWMLAAYYEGIRSSVADIQHFNALNYEEDFRLYALGLHFQSFVINALNGTTSMPSLKTILGYMNGDNFVAGSFAKLTRYATGEAREYIAGHYDGLKALYYETLYSTLMPLAFDMEQVDVFTAHNERDIGAHFIAYCMQLADEEGNITYSFEDVFGKVEDGEFITGAFTQLVQYSSEEQYFKNNYDHFKHLFGALQQDRAALSLAWLPQGVRQYALLREYYLQHREGVLIDNSRQLAYWYGVENDEDLVQDADSFVRLTQLAYSWDRQTPLEEYLKENDITDEKERNFVILASLYPQLADPVNVIVSDNQVGLVLTGYEMHQATEDIFEAITSNDDNGLQALLALCIYAANRDKFISEQVYTFILTMRDTFNQYRDYLPIVKQYYEEYAPEEDSLSPFKDFIVNDVEKLKDRKLVKIENTGNSNSWYADIDYINSWYNSLTTELQEQWKSLYDYFIYQYKLNHTVDYRYFDDVNNNGTRDEGELYLADFLDEYRTNGYGLIIEKKDYSGVDEITADFVHGNAMGYYGGQDRSYFNAILEEATTMSLQLNVLVKVAELAVQESNTFVLYDDNDTAMDLSFIQDLSAFIQQANTYDILRLGDSSPEEDEGSQTAHGQVEDMQAYLTAVIQSGDDARVSQLIDTMREKNSGVENALIEAYKAIEKMGILLESGNLKDYLESPYFTQAKGVYENNKQRFEEAQKNLDAALNTYYKAQDEYTRQLEIITILYNRLEEARKLKEDEEMLYAYASTPYLYNTEANAEGGDVGVSKLKADAKEQLQLAEKYRNEVLQKIQELEQKVAEVKGQNVEQDAQYVKLRDELRQRAQRAYRMEKAAMCMQNEIKKLSVAYEEAKAKYEAAKDAFIAATDDEYKDERDRLLDEMINNSFVNGTTTVSMGSIHYSISSLELQLKTAAYYYNDHISWYDKSRILTTKPYFGSIPDGDEIERMNSPLYTYLLMTKNSNKQIHVNQYIESYLNEFLKARDNENKYDNLMVNYVGTYETLYKPHKKVYDYLYNKTIKILGKKIHPLRKVAKSYFKAVLSPIILLLDVLYKPIREAENRMKQHDKTAKFMISKIRSSLNDMQAKKITMLKAKADLAYYTEIESVDDEQAAGAFVYYNPKTMQTVTIQKPTLKQALKEVAKKNKLTLQDSDLGFMITEDRSGDWVNVSNYRTSIKKTNEYGYETNETMQVYHAGTVGQTYANIMNQQRRDCLARYLDYAVTLYTQKGYDRVVVDRAVEKELYKQWADTGEYQSALAIGAESKGTIRGMIAYMGYVEGMPAAVINQLDELVGSSEEGALNGQFAQYVKQYEGINDRELSQRRALQVHQWQLKKQQLQDKKADWDRMVSRIFERGVRQWDMMMKSFVNRWKNWQSEAKEKILLGNKAWDERMKQLEEEKMRWFADAQSGISARELHERLSGIEVIVNDMLVQLKEKYGTVVEKVDVHAMLVELLQEQPQLIHDAVMDLAKTKVEFGLTQLTTRTYNRAIFEDSKKLAQEFAQAQKKTQNLQLLKALTELLERCRKQVEAANENAATAALQFVSAYDFGIDGDTYTRELTVLEKTQKIKAYRPYKYDDSLILRDYTIYGLMQLYNNDDGVRFNATMNVVLGQVQTAMGMMFRPDVPWGFGYYVGQFGQIEYDGANPRLKEGKGEYGRITKDVYNAQKEKATEDAACQYVNAGIAVALTFATGNPVVGAAYMSWGQMAYVATGDLSLQHWAVQTGISMAASYAGGYVGNVTKSAVYGTLASSSIQGLGNFIEYKPDGGLGLQWGTSRQWQSFGIGTVTALGGAYLGAAYGKTWENSWQQYGYTASSSFIVSRFDGHGSWKDDMMQAGASVAALWATHQMMNSDYVTQLVKDKILTKEMINPLTKFIQGTLENVMLAGMYEIREKVDKGYRNRYEDDASYMDRLIGQNWSKTQYTVSDWLSDYAAQKAKSDASKMQDMEKKEGLLGLAWLGLQKAGSLLSGAWSAVAEFFERSKNLIKNIYNGEGILWENDYERANRIAGKILSTMQAIGEMGVIDYEKEFKEKIFKNKTRLDTEKYLIELEARGIDVTALREWADEERKRLGISTDIRDESKIKELEAYKKQVQKEQAMAEEKRRQELVMTLMLVGGGQIPIVGSFTKFLDKVVSNPREMNFNEVKELVANYEQVNDGHLAWVMRDVAEYIKDKSDSWFGGFEFDGKLKQERKELEEQLEELKNNTTMKESEKKSQMASIQRAIESINEKEKRFNQVRDYFVKGDSTKVANDTVSALCAVAAYYFYGMSEGKIDMNFRDFYVDQVRKGNISIGTHNGRQGAFYFSGSRELSKEWGMQYAEVSYDSTKIVEVLEKIKGTTAIGWSGTHFYILKKHNGTWYFMDHSNKDFYNQKLNLSKSDHLERIYQLRYY